jgi:5-methylcytosine-specific restriction endonuclease McrA
MFEDLDRISDGELLARVESLVRDERRVSAALVAHLAEIESRKLYLEQGYSSLFVYCTRALHLSEHAAYNRIEAARVARRVPAVLAWLERGDVHLTAVKLLASVLTPENREQLLAAAKHKSRREIEELVARLRPQPDAPDKVRAVKPRSAAGEGGGQRPGACVASASSSLQANAVECAPVTSSNTSTPVTSMNTGAGPERSTELVPERVHGPTIVPLAPERYKIQFTASAASRDKLRRAQELLRHRIPNGDLAQVFDLALECLLRELEKTKIAATTRQRGAVRRGETEAARAPVSTASRTASRHVPAAVRREVWQRDEGRCAFVGVNGVRCNERGWIEFDHRWPHGDGGDATVTNVRLLCRSHNQHEARSFFGVWANRESQPVIDPDSRPNSSWDELRESRRRPASV